MNETGKVNPNVEFGVGVSHQTCACPPRSRCCLWQPDNRDGGFQTMLLRAATELIFTSALKYGYVRGGWAFRGQVSGHNSGILTQFEPDYAHVNTLIQYRT